VTTLGKSVAVPCVNVLLAGKKITAWLLLVTALGTTVAAERGD
jgi:hypothetical protein